MNRGEAIIAGAIGGGAWLTFLPEANAGASVNRWGMDQPASLWQRWCMDQPLGAKSWRTHFNAAGKSRIFLAKGFGYKAITNRKGKKQ